MKKEVIDVNGMTCSHCESIINDAVGKLNGIKEVKANAQEKNVAVTFDEGIVTHDNIVEAISEEGYEVME